MSSAVQRMSHFVRIEEFDGESFHLDVDGDDALALQTSLSGDQARELLGRDVLGDGILDDGNFLWGDESDEF